MLALATAWLVFGSPWIGMYDRMPDEPGGIWIIVPGTDAVVALRAWHIVAARACVLPAQLHVAGVALHLLDFVRD